MAVIKIIWRWIRIFLAVISEVGSVLWLWDKRRVVTSLSLSAGEYVLGILCILVLIFATWYLRHEWHSRHKKPNESRAELFPDPSPPSYMLLWDVVQYVLNELPYGRGKSFIQILWDLKCAAKDRRIKVEAKKSPSSKHDLVPARVFETACFDAQSTYKIGRIRTVDGEYLDEPRFLRSEIEKYFTIEPRDVITPVPIELTVDDESLLGSHEAIRYLINSTSIGDQTHKATDVFLELLKGATRERNRIRVFGTIEYDIHLVQIPVDVLQRAIDNPDSIVFDDSKNVLMGFTVQPYKKLRFFKHEVMEYWRPKSQATNS